MAARMTHSFRRPLSRAPVRPHGRLGFLVALLCLLTLTPGLVRAQDGEAAQRYYVISIEGPRIFVDLGKKDGVAENQVLQVFRTGVTIEHPVTGNKLVGTTFLGEIKILEVSDVFSICESQPALLSQLKAGYEVRFRPQDVQAVRSARAQLRELAEELAAEEETWYQRVRREMVRNNNMNNRISAFTEYVLFSTGKNTSGEVVAPDYYTRMEVDFTYRLFRRLYAVRFGLGGLDGQGRVENIYDYYTGTSTPRYDRVAYYFGYSSMEIKLARYLSYSPTFQLGLNNEGVGYGFGSAIRIGPEQGTNLVISGSAANLVGSQLALAYNHFINERIALSGKVAWENYVTGSRSDPSVRVLLGAHMDVTKKVRLDLAAGIGGREISHIGPSLMAGLSFNFPTSLWWMQEMEGK